VDWLARLSDIGQGVQPPSLRAIVNRFADVPGVIGLHGGFPAAAAFPIANLSFTTVDGTRVDINDPVKVAAMQQYCVSPLGYAPLAQWAAAFQKRQHSPPCETATGITTGSNCALEMLCKLLLNKGDSILVEEFTYAHMVESTINLHGFKALPVAMDEQGMLPSSLRAVMTAAQSQPNPPRVLYTIPTGQNPTGSTVPLARKAEIYALCQEFDLVLLEDDAYYTLQFPLPSGEPRGLGQLEGSYLSLDTDGRVVRLDSFAKALAPGLRLGWATGSPAIIGKLASCVHGTALGPCATTQVMVAEMLQAWGEEGLEGHVRNMQLEYGRRAGVVLAAAEKHLVGVASWRAPQAGMFLWLTLGAGVTDADEILDLLAEAAVALVPGRIAHALGPHPPLPCPFLRLSFAAAPDDQLQEAMKRLGHVLRTFAAKKNAEAGGSSEVAPAAAVEAAARTGEPAPPPAAAAL